MVAKLLKPAGLDGLCASERLQLLDSIDALRSQGISKYISLPQIIVCGDQSSGKSSVLEAISGVPFPVKSNLCTRFPTEVVLRKTATSDVKVSIVPHPSHAADDKKDLVQFDERLEVFTDLPNVIDRAKTKMGIMTMGKTFSRDILRIEISGPDHPHLTIVDLPGLIHSENKYQSASDIRLIQDVVRGYMEQPRSIILAVVSAKNDYANQIVLKLARKADRKGHRSLGVITKPDTLLPGSGSEEAYISLARNQDIEFRLGWHVLRNADSEAEPWTPAERDAQEAEFFARGSWTALSHSALGVKQLRDKLSKLLSHQIAAELPNLIEELNIKYSQCQVDLDKLGKPRETEGEQRLYLLKVSQSCQSLIKAAIDGTYNDSFFGDVMSTSGYERRLRAVVQNLGLDFSKQMSEHGQKYKITPSTVNCRDPRDIHEADYIAKIQKLMERSRGRELPGMFNPMIVSDLFKEQSAPWERIAKDHVKKVWTTVRTFLQHLTAHIADSAASGALMETVVEPQLETLLVCLMKKTTKLLKPHQQGHPITYNSTFTEALNNERIKRQTAEIAGVMRNFFGSDYLHASNRGTRYMNLDVARLNSELSKVVEQDVSHYSASRALEYVEAYYQIALQRFIDDISVEVIEDSLHDMLGHILDPTAVYNMSTAHVTKIAGETEQCRLARELLSHQLEILNSGMETCKRYLGNRISVLSGEEPEDSDGSSIVSEGDNGMLEPEISKAYPSGDDASPEASPPSDDAPREAYPLSDDALSEAHEAVAEDPEPAAYAVSEPEVYAVPEETPTAEVEYLEDGPAEDGPCVPLAPSPPMLSMKEKKKKKGKKKVKKRVEESPQPEPALAPCEEEEPQLPQVAVYEAKWEF